MDERMVAEDEGEVGTVDPLETEESPLAAPPLVPPPPTPVPDPEPIPLDDPGAPIVTQPDRPDLGLAEPIGDDPAAPAELPPVDPGAPPPAADPGGLMAQALARLDGLEAGLGRRLDALQASIERENRAEASREKVVDRLHAELQEAKQGFVLNILRPVLTDLIKLHDDMGKMADAHEARGSGEDAEAPGADRLVRALRDYQQEVEDILYRQGVEPFREEGPNFDPRRQRGLSTVATPDPGLAKTVAARLRPGFQAGDKVIRPEIVAVFAHKPS